MATPKTFDDIPPDLYKTTIDQIAEEDQPEFVKNLSLVNKKTYNDPGLGDRASAAVAHAKMPAA